MVAEVELKDSLNSVALGDDESSNENSIPVTADVTCKCSGNGAGVVGSPCGLGRGLSVGNSEGGSVGECPHFLEEPSRQKPDIVHLNCSCGGGSHGDGSHGDGSRGDDNCGDGSIECAAVSDTNVLKEKSLNPAILGGKDQTSPTPTIPQDDKEIPLVKADPSLECSDPPSSVVDSTLADILTESAVLNKDNCRRPVVNPFAKLQSHGHNTAVHFTSSPAAPTTAGRRGGNEQGLPLSTTRKGLSLKARKRKFVMSPSKPQQGKPVKQISRVQTENDETTKCVPLSRSLSYTPPLFSTPIPLTPSLFSPRERDLLQQYEVHTTPCRR